MAWIENLISSVLDFVFPRKCYMCGSFGNYICKNCRKNLNMNYVQRCHVCGKETRLGFVHTECKESSYLDGLIYVVLYDGKVKTMIKDVKYHFYSNILSEVSKIMTDHISKYNFDNPMYTSVPLHWKKKNYRGFNQAEVLSKQIAKLSGEEYFELIKRVENTKAQATLGKEGRESNLKTAFRISEDYDVSGRNIIIVDDVFTTGSTLNECAKVLKNFRAQNVYGFCFAKSRQ